MRILLIEDSRTDARLVMKLLESPEGEFELDIADTLETGMRMCSAHHFDVLLLDLFLPDSTGIATFERAHRENPRIPIILLTASDDETNVVEAVRQGAQDYLLKGEVTRRLLRRSITYAIERTRLLEQLEQRTEELEQRQADFLTVINKNLDAMLVIDEGQQVVFANPAAEALFGQPLCGNAVPLHDLEVVSEQGEWHFRREQVEVQAEANLVRIIWEGRQATLASLRDVTERKRAEQERQSLIEQLQERVKEMSALHSASQMLQREDLETAVLLRQLVRILPPAFYFPDLTRARISFGPHCVSSHPGNPPEHGLLQERFTTHDKQSGLLEVWCEEESGQPSQLGFLQEARALLSTIAGMLCSYLDRLHAHQQLANQEAVLRGVMDTLPVGVWITDETGRVVNANPAARGFLSGNESSQHEALQTLRVWHPGSDTPLAPDEWGVGKALRNGMPVLNALLKIETGEGREKKILNSAIPVFDDRGALQRVIGVNQDVTQLMEAENAVRLEAELRLAILDTLPFSVLLLDEDGKVLAANEGWGLLLDQRGCRADDACVGQQFLDIFREAACCGETEAPFVCAGLIGVLNGAVPTFLIEYCCDCDGREQWLRMTINPLRREDRRGAVVIYQDVTVRKEAEEELRRQKELLQKIVDHVPVMIALVEQADKVRWVNREWERVLGWTLEEAQQGDVFPQMFPEEKDLDHLHEFIRKPSAAWEDFKTRTKKGTVLTTSWANVLLSDGTSIGIGQDLTQRRLLEEELMQAQKMEGIGRLAGGVAHDFNNLLSAILGYAEFALAGLDRSSPLRSDIEQIQKAGMRATDLTRQLLAFARRQIIAPRLVDLNELISGTSRLLRRLIGEDVELALLLEAELPKVRLDPGQFEQVLVNLAVNARDAMPGGGKLSIKTHQAIVGEEYETRFGRNRSGPHVVVTVLDTGHGMPAETIKHAFEPFFTTKEVGKGTGLGLATCYGIIKQAEGDIWLSSTLDEGTAIEMYLPAINEVETASAHRRTEQTVRGGTETVLLVEDEPLVREMVSKALQKLGYKVLVADGGTEALRLAESYEEEIHLLLTDVVMPHMGGKEVAERLGAQRPDMKILFMSGYTEDAILRQGAREGVALLSKPFTARALAARVRELLENAPGGE